MTCYTTTQSIHTIAVRTYVRISIVACTNATKSYAYLLCEWCTYVLVLPIVTTVASLAAQARIL